ncbi:hypothetical protein KC353_g5519 [Hortaea werneckii]|nr:hypothetical protein KC353_g5519 [Hortaea werneckii]
MAPRRRSSSRRRSTEAMLASEPRTPNGTPAYGTPEYKAWLSKGFGWSAEDHESPVQKRARKAFERQERLNAMYRSRNRALEWNLDNPHVLRRKGYCVRPPEEPIDEPPSPNMSTQMAAEQSHKEEAGGSRQRAEKEFRKVYIANAVARGFEPWTAELVDIQDGDHRFRWPANQPFDYLAWCLWVGVEPDSGGTAIFTRRGLENWENRRTFTLEEAQAIERKVSRRYWGSVRRNTAAQPSLDEASRQERLETQRRASEERARRRDERNRRKALQPRVRDGKLHINMSGAGPRTGRVTRSQSSSSQAPMLGADESLPSSRRTSSITSRKKSSDKKRTRAEEAMLRFV